MKGEWISDDLFIDEFGIKYDGDMKIIGTVENIKTIFDVFDWDTPLLQKRQIDFMKSLKDYFDKNGKLSQKQFKWLCVYYGMSCDYDSGLGDSEYFKFGNSVY